MRVVGQYVQPAHLAVDVPALRVADRVPYARQPMGDQRERGHQQQQHGRAVFRVPVDLPGHPDQPQQPGSLQQSDQRGRLRSQVPGISRRPPPPSLARSYRAPAPTIPRRW